MEYSACGRCDIVEQIVVKMAEQGMKTRGWAIEEIQRAAVEHKVSNKGASFAGVVLWEA
jgi:pyruvoyl-dependent arginine decarboxylase (PvlArgDC)